MAHNGAGDTATASKKAKLDDSVEEKEFDEETQAALEEIDGCQNDIDAMNEKASEEILKVEQKYNQLRKPHFEKRSGIIGRIPKFWLTAFINHPQLSSIIEEEEEDCLQYLDKLEVEEFEDIKSGFKIQFNFSDNPYFSTKVLCKEFHLGSSGDPESKSTEIQWKEGYNLVEKAKQREAMANAKSRKRQLESRTFFTWFEDNSDPQQDDVAEVIKDDLWWGWGSLSTRLNITWLIFRPNPLQYFLVPDIEVENGAEDDEDDEDDDNSEAEEDEDGGEEEDVEEEEDEK